MSEEEKKNSQIEDEEEDSEDDDYMPSDEDDKGLSFENAIASKLNLFNCFSLINPFSNQSDNESIDELDEDDLNEIKTDDKVINDKQKSSEDEKKRRADELWADLCSSTSKEKKKISSNESTSLNKLTSINNKSKNESNVLNSSIIDSTKSDKIKVTKEYDFAGEMIKIEEEVDANKINSNNVNKSSNSITTNVPMKRGLGINSLVANLGKKPKLSTLTKTKLDWDIFKKSEGIEEDLKNHTKNKNSFVEKQAFLQRADLKQFELEKTIREKNRKYKELN